MKGLRRVRQDGKLYVYHRATGIRMPDLPENHLDFLDAYREAERSRTNPKPRGKGKPGTMLAVWHAYCTSDAFAILSVSYQGVRRRDGHKLIETGGAVPIRSIKPGHIQNDLAALTPHQARERRKTWRAIMAFAMARGLIQVDPSADVKTAAPPKPRQHEPWTQSDVEAFRSRWTIGSAQRLAFELIHWAGCRISDAVRLGPGHVSADGWLEYRQQKTAGHVAIPFDRPLPEFANPADLAHLHASIAALGTRHMTWLATATGRSRSEKAASQWFSAAARTAGLKGRTAHGLRVTRAILLAESGASTHQIGAWTGHESLKEIAHYSHQADKKRILDGPKTERKIVQNRNS